MLMLKVRRFAGAESGATAIEYGLIAALIAVALIVSMTVFGNGLTDLFNYVEGRSGNAMASTAI
jgi:pilus assembly protein Flp/PilA